MIINKRQYDAFSGTKSHRNLCTLFSSITCAQASHLVIVTFDLRHVMEKAVTHYCAVCRSVNLYMLYFAFLAIKTANDALKIP